MPLFGIFLSAADYINLAKSQRRKKPKGTVMFPLYVLNAVWNLVVEVCVCFVSSRGGEECLLFFALVLEEL